MSLNKKTSKPAGKKTVLRRITGIIGYVIIFLIAALFVFVISFKVNNRTLFVFGKATVWVMTPSMEPTIPEQSYILIRRASADEIKVGDIIMFKSSDPSLNGANNTHRVIDISDDHKIFTTKGDANALKDELPAQAENIVGVYEKNLPVLSAIGRFIFSGIGMIITMTLIFVIIMIIYLPDVIRATREKTKLLEEKRQAQIEDLVRAEVERLKRESEAAENKPEEQKTGAEEKPETENNEPDDELPDTNKEETNTSVIEPEKTEDQQ